MRLREIMRDVKKRCSSCGKRRVMRGILVDDVFVGEACATCRDKYLHGYLNGKRGRRT